MFEKKSIWYAIKGRMSAVAGAAAIISALAITPAYAISNAAECNAEVVKITQSLLKANVSSDQVNSIYTSINSAEQSCANGDFAAAQNALNTAGDLLKAATAN